MATLTIKNVDSQLKRQFRIACLRNDYTMSEVLIHLMKDYVARVEATTGAKGPEEDAV